MSRQSRLRIKLIQAVNRTARVQRPRLPALRAAAAAALLLVPVHPSRRDSPAVVLPRKVGRSRLPAREGIPGVGEALCLQAAGGGVDGGHCGKGVAWAGKDAAPGGVVAALVKDDEGAGASEGGAAEECHNDGEEEARRRLRLMGRGELEGREWGVGQQPVVIPAMPAMLGNSINLRH